MKFKSSVGNILWSVVYVCLAVVALKVTITSEPTRVGAVQQGQRKSLEEAFLQQSYSSSHQAEGWRERPSIQRRVR